MAKPSIRITQDPNNPEPPEVMARSIVEIAEGARKLLGSRLKERAVLVLLKDATGETLETIRRVLNAAASLDKTYLKLAVLALVGWGLSACAHAPAQPAPASKVAMCNESPAWITTDPKNGHRVGIFICFGEDNHLLYATRELPNPAPAPASASVTGKDNAGAGAPAALKKAQRTAAKVRKLAEAQAKRDRELEAIAAEATRNAKALKIEMESKKQAEAIARANQAASEALQP